MRLFSSLKLPHEYDFRGQPPARGAGTRPAVCRARGARGCGEAGRGASWRRVSVRPPWTWKAGFPSPRAPRSVRLVPAILIPLVSIPGSMCARAPPESSGVFYVSAHGGPSVPRRGRCPPSAPPWPCPPSAPPWLTLLWHLHEEGVRPKSGSARPEGWRCRKSHGLWLFQDRRLRCTFPTNGSLPRWGFAGLLSGGFTSPPRPLPQHQRGGPAGLEGSKALQVPPAAWPPFRGAQGRAVCGGSPPASPRAALRPARPDGPGHGPAPQVSVLGFPSREPSSFPLTAFVAP